MAASASDLYGRGVWNIWIWMFLGLSFVALNFGDSSNPRSPYWYFELILFGLMLLGMWANANYSLRHQIRIHKRLAPLVYCCLVWLFGMMYEMSLTVTGEGIGGLHNQTIPSFILAQGDYIPIAIVSYMVIRKTQASYREIFFFAGGKSLTEGLIFTGVLTSVLLSPMFWLSPLLIAYYTMAYSSFIALPLLFIDEKLLWKNETKQVASHWIPYYWVVGFALAMLIRLVWGLVYGPIATEVFNLPSN